MVDYSSWKKIELSSDEDETHPFIDNATLFRLKHEARLKKMEKRKQEEFALECRRANYLNRLDKIQEVMQHTETTANDSQNELLELESEKVILDQQESKLSKEPVNWYIDTICHPGFSESFINQSFLELNTMSEIYIIFVHQNKPYLKQFSTLKTFEETKTFLLFHPQIIKRQTLYFLISYGIKFYLEKEKDKLITVSRQIVLLLHILELFKIFNRNSKDLLMSFFTSINSTDKHCKSEFEKECVRVRKQIKNLIISKLNRGVCSKMKCELTENSEKSVEHSSDPEKVFNSLPEDMRLCFLNRDKAGLAETLSNMSPEDAAYLMKRCVDSGLWIPE